METEEWRPIPKSRYEASSLGRIRHRDGPVLNQRLMARGYLVTSARVRGHLRDWFVHRLVLAAFCGEPADGQEARHLNGNRTDNRVENLAWGTHRENCADQAQHGTHRNTVKTHCKRGHLFDEANTYIRPGGQRNCRECKREYDHRNWRKYYDKARQS